MAASPREDLLSLLRPVVEVEGLDLEDIEVTPAGKRRLVRVLVDKNGGVPLDDIAAISSRISAALDEAGSVGETPYVLEVSSPGVSRPLTEHRHWRRNRGRLVEVALSSGDTLVGRVREAGEAGIALEVDAVLRQLPWSEITSGQVQVEFSHAGGIPGIPGDTDVLSEPTQGA